MFYLTEICRTENLDIQISEQSVNKFFLKFLFDIITHAISRENDTIFQIIHVYLLMT